MYKNLIFNISMSMIIGSDLREIGLRFINDHHHDNSERHSLHNYATVSELDFGGGGGVSVCPPLSLIP
jgi:hypothetical protein